MSRAEDPRLARLDRLARLMDTRFRVPLLGLRVGWDGILGLVPGIGDAVTLLPAGVLLAEGWRLGARRRTLLRMGLNIALDTGLGSVPVVGDLFDIGFKSNRRNVALLRRDLARRGSARP